MTTREEQDFNVLAATRFIDYKKSLDIRLVEPINPMFRFSELQIPQRVHEKFVDLVNRRSPYGLSIVTAWTCSRLRELAERERHDLYTVFGFKDQNRLWARHFAITENTTIVFLGYENIIFEIVSWRGIRGLCRIWQYRHRDKKMARPSEKDRIHSISKEKHRKQIQGGLLRQERCPRDKWSKVRVKVYS